MEDNLVFPNEVDNFVLFESISCEDDIVFKMEEEEETCTNRKQRRKRKPRNYSPELVTPADSEEEINDGEEKKKKRGRKRKKKEPPAIEPEEELTDLQLIFQVVEQLMSAAGSVAFLDRPDDTMYGMSDYYEVITKPMWLREIERKYRAEEYSTVTEIAADVRLMLENCYHYWGPCDTLSKQALKLEQMFENKLGALPEELRIQCSLECTHGDMVKEESPDSMTRRSASKKGGYTSKLLNWVLSGRGRSEGDPEKPVSAQETQSKARKAEREAAEKQLTQWETENILMSGTKEQISSMWEFPVIGQFLHLVYNVLNIDPISHLELERMLLMPQASKTLATVMTSMLIPPLFRAKLEVGPAMPYAIWTRRLKVKVASWYRAYHSKGDSTVEVFDSLGIEPQFWLVMGEENPLEDYQFHELSFLQRVWLLKALCDFLLHNHKTIQECINNLEMEELREMNLGRDKDGYSYHYFPMFTEVRIYKMAKVPDTKWKNYEGGVEEAITMCAEEEDDEDQSQEPNLIGFTRRPLHKPPRSMRPSHSDFRVVCESLEDIRRLVDKFCEADPLLLQGQGKNAALMASLQKVISQLESREGKMELAVFNIRSKMRDEWRQFKERSSDFVDPGLAYWERKEKEEKRSVEEKPPDSGFISDILPEDEKRERRTRRESSLKLLSREDGGVDDESAEESPLDFDDDSEDEWFASKKDKENKKKKRCMSAKKLKRLADIGEKVQQSTTTKDRDVDKLNLNTSGSGFESSIKVKAGGNAEPPVKIKEELPDPDDPQIKKKATKPVHSTQTKSAARKSQDGFNSGGVETAKNTNAVPVICKQEIIDEPQPAQNTSRPNSVIQTLVPPVNMASVKREKASKNVPTTPDLSKVKRSNSPDPNAEVVYISDSEDPPDVKPNPTLLAQRLSTKPQETIHYLSQQPVGGYLVPTGQPPGQFVPMQPQLYNPAPPTAITYQTLVQPQGHPTIVRTALAPNQKFLVIQPPSNNANQQPNQFMNKNPPPPPRGPANNFPTTPTMQSVNWFGGSPRGGSPQQNTVNYSPRQRAPGVVMVQGQSTRGRGSPRSPMTPTRGGARFSGRTPPSNVRSPNSLIRTPPQIGARTPSPMRGRGAPTAVRGGPVRGAPARGGAGPVRNLNFNRSPAKPPPAQTTSDLGNSTPDIEGTLVVSMTDTGGFGYVVMLPDGGKISLTQDQLAKIRSDNGGTLPKTCKVPLNMQTEGFRID